MIKNIKPFLLLLSPFLLLPSFFFLPSSSQSAFVASSKSSRVYPSDSWTPQEIQKNLSVLSEKRNYKKVPFWLQMVALGLKKLEFKSGNKDVVYHFDKLALAFQEQIRIQKIIPQNSAGFDYTKIQGEAQKQLLQPYHKGTIYFVEDFHPTIISILDKYTYAKLFFDSIKPSLLKMQVLGLSQVKVSYVSNFSITSLFNKDLNNVFSSSKKIKGFYFSFPVNKDIEAARITFENFVFLTFSPIPNFAKTILDKAINDDASPWLHALQKTSILGLTYITVDKERIDVSSLVSFKTQEASDLSLDQLRTIKKLKSLGLQNLKIQAKTKTNEVKGTVLPENQKKLIIGLSVAGGTLTLSALGGFLY